MKKIVGGVAAGALLIGLAAVVPATAESAARSGVVLGASTITWATCSDPGLTSFGAQCATLRVPLDYSNPNGPKITLALSRVQHTSSAADYQGVMLVNPGGPGGGGVGLSFLGQLLPNGAGDVYDWIGWDPRGVGTSVPALHCEPYIQGYDRPPYVPNTAKRISVWKSRAKAYAAACQRKAPALLKHVKTIDSVHDMNRIRVALGAQQINYYGFSYGTYLGAVFGSTYPTRIRRMVLDGNVDPRGVWYRGNLEQDQPFGRNIKIWFGWLAKYNGIYHLGSTAKAVEATYYKQLAALDKHAAGGKIGGDEWTDIFLSAGYYQVTWPELAGAFSGWVNHGDWQTLKAEYDSSATPGDDNGYAMYTATQCTDAPWPKSWSTWLKDNNAIYHTANGKFLTWDNAWYNAPCLYWAAKPGKAPKVDGSHVASALLISETLDAATPFEGSLELRSLFPNSSLIAEPGGTTHAGTLSGNACVDGQIADYLLTGTRPPRLAWRGPDALCKPLPQPSPTARVALRGSNLPMLSDLIGSRP